MKAKKKITEKGSYENGKVETYASKSAMAKHEKKETKSFEKKESVKPKGPLKQVTGGKGSTSPSTKTPSTTTPRPVPKTRTTATVDSPAMMKKSPVKAKKC